MSAIEETLHEFVRRGQAAQSDANHVLWLVRIRACLQCWLTVRRRGKLFDETQQLVAEIDDWLLRR
jgi:hypothetical protein